jgi:hypothetical protein
MDAKAIADKYIAPDGSAPTPGVVYVKTVIKELADQGKIDMVSAVAHFIAYHRKNDMHGGHTAEGAWKAFCCILDIHDDDVFYNIVRPTPTMENE